VDLLVALSALKVAGEEGGGWTRSFARDAGRRGAGHNIDVMWYYCPALLFEYRVKQKNDLKQHRANVHDIGTIARSTTARTRRSRRATSSSTEPACTASHPCTKPSLRLQGQVDGDITKHKANKHNIGVQWKQCPHCVHKSKQNSHLNEHIESHHTSK